MDKHKWEDRHMDQLNLLVFLQKQHSAINLNNIYENTRQILEYSC